MAPAPRRKAGKDKKGATKRPAAVKKAAKQTAVKVEKVEKVKETAAKKPAAAKKEAKKPAFKDGYYIVVLVPPAAILAFGPGDAPKVAKTFRKVVNNDHFINSSDIAEVRYLDGSHSLDIEEIKPLGDTLAAYVVTDD